MKMMRIILSLVGIFCIYLAIQKYSTKPWAPSCFHCNVVVIMIDSLRADSLPCYGYRFNTAPNMCAFAKNNTLFTQAFSNSSWTLPSSLSFFTSLYPYQHTVSETLQDSLNKQITPLPQHLKKHGYDTFFVGNNQPNIGLHQGLEQGFTSTTITSDTLDESIHSWVQAIDTIHMVNDRRRKPAFVFLHTDGVHNYQNHQNRVDLFPLDPTYSLPALPPLEYTHRFQTALRDRLVMNIQFPHGSAEEVEKNKSWYSQLLAAKTEQETYDIFLRLTNDDKDYVLSRVVRPVLETQLTGYVTFMQHVYDDHIRQTDLFIKQVIDRLERNGLLRNTIVIISSEHGELLGEGGLIGHGQKMYNPEIHVPLIMHIPKNPADKKITGLVQLIDLYPTLLDILDLPSPEHTMTGISLKPMIYGIPKGPTNPYSISQWTSTWNSNVMQNAQWKWFEDARGERTIHELYNLREDPGERANIAALHVDITSDFTKTYTETLKKHPIYLKQMKPLPDWIDTEHRKNLIETGYFDSK